eukprot:SAG11_NODE_2426_length_3376_cov_4.541044_1_plen_498_part_00
MPSVGANVTALLRFLRVPRWVVELALLGTAVGSILKFQRLRNKFLKQPLIARVLRIAIRTRRARQVSYLLLSCFITTAALLRYWALRKKLLKPEGPIHELRSKLAQTMQQMNRVQQLATSVAKRSAAVEDELKRTQAEIRAARTSLSAVEAEHKSMREALQVAGTDFQLVNNPASGSQFEEIPLPYDSETAPCGSQSEADVLAIAGDPVDQQPEAEAEVQLLVEDLGVEVEPGDEPEPAVNVKSESGASRLEQELADGAAMGAGADDSEDASTKNADGDTDDSWRGEALAFLSYAPDRYDELLGIGVRSAVEMFRAADLVPPTMECEVHPSAPSHFRQRVGFAVYCPEAAGEWHEACPGDDGRTLRYVYWHAGKLMPVPENRFPRECPGDSNILAQAAPFLWHRSRRLKSDGLFAVASRPIHDLMPIILERAQDDPVLHQGLRSAKYKATMTGEVLLTLVYKHRALGEDWLECAERLRAELAPRRLIGIIGRSKGTR